LNIITVIFFSPSAIVQANYQVEQLATNVLTMPQDVIASLLERLVLHSWFRRQLSIRDCAKTRMRRSSKDSQQWQQE
jgi:ribose 5-phosphate isomerase RpiB